MRVCTIKILSSGSWNGQAEGIWEWSSHKSTNWVSDLVGFSVAHSCFVQYQCWGHLSELDINHSEYSPSMVPAKWLTCHGHLRNYRSLNFGEIAQADEGGAYDGNRFRVFDDRRDEVP